jgi:adenylate cyclase
MNSYYERLFVPVKANGGVVSDVVGDSMMAIWAKPNPDANLRAAACRAALEIAEAIRAFNQQQTVTLQTRIGMHAGHILVGNIGAVDHFEYRPVGDIVNTASRMEGMNKYLGTQILVSDQVLHRVQGFMTRLLGVFQPFGKANAITIHELLGYEKEASSEQQALRRSFQTGLSAFQHRRWNEAVSAFERTLSVYRADGPSIFYLKLCAAFKSHPPPDDWDGTVVMDRK